MSKTSYGMRKCDRCGIDIFFAQYNEKWIPFNAGVETIARKGILYVDGYDEILRTESAEPVKGMPCHFDYCNK